MLTSVDNPRIKAARKLLNRRHRTATDRVLLEGVRLIQDALHSQVACEVAFYAPELMAANQAAMALVHQLREQQVECQPCSPPVLASLTETVTPQGLVVVAHLPQFARPAAPTFTLILDQVRDPGNAGTLLRAAEAAGVDLVIFAPGAVDAYNDKVLRAGMGAHFRLPLRQCATWADVTQLLDARQQLYLADVAATVAYDMVAWREPVALVIGGEAQGASPAARAAAQPIYIPMQGQSESLNAAVAGAIILFEAARQRRHSA